MLDEVKHCSERLGPASENTKRCLINVRFAADPTDKVSVEPTLCDHGALLAEPTYHRRRERNLNEIGLNVA